jgi:cystathionine gamma-lyase
MDGRTSNGLIMKKTSEKQSFYTRVIHGGQHVDEATGAVMTPIYTSSTYAQESPGKHKGFEYSRSQNPTRFAYERSIANLEEGTAGFAFASGLAATSTILELVDSGAHVVAMDDMYGGTYRLLENVRKRSAGYNITYVDLTDANAFAKAITPETKLVWIETPSNPMLKIVDIAKISEIAHNSAKGVIVAVDNTFATPFNQRPLTLGADLVMHSATKYLSGHSDMVGGMVVVGDNHDVEERLRYLQNAIGSVAGPFDSYLALRGVKTLALRMQQHNKSAGEIAAWLVQHPAVTKVIYPGLPYHPQCELASAQMDGYGGMISIFLNGGLKHTKKFLEKVQIFALAESLGGVESLIEHPAIMTHASIPKKQRKALGIHDNFVRLSIGIEDTGDLIEALDLALKS